MAMMMAAAVALLVLSVESLILAGWLQAEKSPAGAGQVLSATRGPTEGLSCLNRDGFFQPSTFVAVKLEKSPGFSERDVVFASEVAQLVVLGLRDRAPVGSANLVVVGHIPSSEKHRIWRERDEVAVVQKKLPQDGGCESGGTPKKSAGRLIRSCWICLHTGAVGHEAMIQWGLCSIERWRPVTGA
jgi:hypothetical protein